MKHIIKHELYGDVLFDTKTQSFLVIDYVRMYGEDVDTLHKNNNVLMFNGGKKPFRFFDSTREFLESSVERCVVPLVCTGFKPIKKRTMITMLDINNSIIDFYNVELIGTSIYGKPVWLENKIENIYTGRCYFCLLEKNSKTINDFRLLSSKEITKGMHENIP